MESRWKQCAPLNRAGFPGLVVGIGRITEHKGKKLSEDQRYKSLNPSIPIAATDKKIPRRSYLDRGLLRVAGMVVISVVRGSCTGA
jgi:hypothetical protein